MDAYLNTIGNQTTGHNDIKVNTNISYHTMISGEIVSPSGWGATMQSKAPGFDSWFSHSKCIREAYDFMKFGNRIRSNLGHS